MNKLLKRMNISEGKALNIVQNQYLLKNQQILVNLINIYLKLILSLLH